MSFHVEECFTIERLADLSVLKLDLRNHDALGNCRQDELEKLLLVATELGTNLIKHAGGGKLIFRVDLVKRRIEFETTDEGPGISNIGEVVTDGYSSTNSLGNGLGTVNRLMDELSILKPNSGKGVRLLCSKAFDKQILHPTLCPLDVGVASRAMPGGKYNGDSFIVKHFSNNLLVGVIDGVGHGKFANIAAQKARQYVTDHFDQPLLKIFTGTDRVCRGTRGVVMALILFDWSGGSIAITHASIGNISIKGKDGTDAKLPLRRGIVGVNAPEPLIHRQDYPPDETLIVFSDGISGNWRGVDENIFSDTSAERIAKELLSSQAKDNDDATIMVIQQKLQNTTW